jgi:putative peptide zinc metalloprotease protein
VTIVETRISVWEALAGRAPGQPLGPADPGLWTAVAERVNPAKARPVVRPGIEESNLVSARGVPYTMLRSPDGAQACYLRLAPDEVELTHLMDGSRTLARLVAEFARISGRLAPDQVRRIVADLAGNRMLEELPIDAFRPLQKVNRRPWPIRLGRGLLAFAQGRRMVIANVDPVISLLYRAGGRVLFTRPVAALLGAVAIVGLVAFGWQWWTGEQSVFLTKDSYAIGAAVLLGLNIMALACHELGHALATKHAGRRVPAAGFLVYFGIPSVFVDTTDVWMAGRRGRLLTTASGPATGLVLAGASALVGLAVPEAAPWCFKLSFAWYVNALFNLNPFLALDGYYLLMDWLEVPNLRGRGLSWVAARLRRRPPAWSALDREGRLVALYGLLAVAWLVIAANIAYRVYVDRVGGLITGLWRSGWLARALLVVVVAALMSPIVYIVLGWLARRWRRLGDRMSEWRVKHDAPRRLDALRTSALRDLPDDLLAELAGKARWVHPRTGTQLIFAGAAQPNVFAVIDGALEGRAPGDPPGTVRERVTAGGVVGLGAAVAGSPASLSWYTAGTTLLALPSTAVAGAVGQTGAHSSGTLAEAEQLFADVPALAGLSYEDRLGLATAAAAANLGPGVPVNLTGPDEVLVVASGTLSTPDGQQLGRGSLIGPAGVEHPGSVAVTRSPARLFSLPAVSGLSLLLGTGGGSGAEGPGAPGRPPVSGVHPARGYAPLIVPPGPPPPTVDDSQDRWFEKRLRWLLILFVLIALLFTGGNVLLSPIAFAEMPSDKVLVRVERGDAHVVVNGVAYDLAVGDEIYAGETDEVKSGIRSRVRMIYRGGAASILCAGTYLTVGRLFTIGSPSSPSANLKLHNGLALMDTKSTSPAFTDLESTVTLSGGVAANQGAAWFAVAPWGVQVSEGRVTYGGALEPADGNPIGCGDGTVVERPSGPPSPTPDVTDTPAVTPSPTDATPSPTPTVGPTVPVTTTTRRTTSPPRTTTKPPPPPDQPPSVLRVTSDPQIPRFYALNAAGAPCQSGPSTVRISVAVTDPDNAVSSLHVVIDWYASGFLAGSNISTTLSGGAFVGTIGNVSETFGPKTFENTVEISATVTDPAGKSGTLRIKVASVLVICRNG